MAMEVVARFAARCAGRQVPHPRRTGRSRARPAVASGRRCTYAVGSTLGRSGHTCRAPRPGRPPTPPPARPPRSTPGPATRPASARVAPRPWSPPASNQCQASATRTASTDPATTGSDVEPTRGGTGLSGGCGPGRRASGGRARPRRPRGRAREADQSACRCRHRSPPRWPGPQERATRPRRRGSPDATCRTPRPSRRKVRARCAAGSRYSRSFLTGYSTTGARAARNRASSTRQKSCCAAVDEGHRHLVAEAVREVAVGSMSTSSNDSPRSAQTRATTCARGRRRGGSPARE